MVLTSFSLALLPPATWFRILPLTTLISGSIIIIAIYGASLLGGHIWLAFIFILMVSTIMLTIKARYSNFLFSADSIILLTILAVIYPIEPVHAIDRVTSAGIGIIGVLLLQLFLSFYVLRVFWQNALTECVKYLNQLSGEIFACFVMPDYQPNFYLFEHRIHQQKIKILTVFKELRRYTLDQKSPSEYQLNIVKQLDIILDVLLSCGLLRHRVKDFALFNICSNESNAILKSIQDNFQTIIKLINYKVVPYNDMNIVEAIKNLEINYANVLKVTAPEPLVFFLFIATLKNLETELKALYQIILAARFQNLSER